ncbi:MAG: MarC family protein [Myxococcaceae bacterium]
MSLFSMTLTFFLILDSVGHIADFNDFLQNVSKRRQRFILFREMAFALGLLVLFHYFGVYLINGLQVSPGTIRISGGLVLFLIAIKMVFPTETRPYKTPVGEPFIVPMAIPMIAGPSILAVVMFYASTETRSYEVLSAILLAWLASVSLLWVCWEFRHKINLKVLSALERLMGLLLTMLAVEMFLKGLRIFLWKQSL